MDIEWKIECDCCGKTIYNAKTNKMHTERAWHFEGGEDYCSPVCLEKGACMSPVDFDDEEYENNSMWWESPDNGDNDPYDMREHYVTEAMPIGPKTPDFELKWCFRNLDFWTARDRHLWSGAYLYDMKQRRRRAMTELAKRELLKEAYNG